MEGGNTGGLQGSAGDQGGEPRVTREASTQATSSARATREERPRATREASARVTREERPRATNEASARATRQAWVDWKAPAPATTWQGRWLPSGCKAQLPSKAMAVGNMNGFLKAGRPCSERHKGCSDKKSTRQHKCPICTEYGHHWHNCKKGNPEDIAAMMAVRGPPKKKQKTTKSTHSSIVPYEADAPQPSMSFPQSQSLETTTETTTKKKGKKDHNQKACITKPKFGDHK